MEKIVSKKSRIAILTEISFGREFSKVDLLDVLSHDGSTLITSTYSYSCYHSTGLKKVISSLLNLPLVQKSYILGNFAK